MRNREADLAPAPICLQVEHDFLAQVVGARHNGGNADGMPLEPSNAGHVEEQELVGFHLCRLQDDRRFEHAT